MNEFPMLRPRRLRIKPALRDIMLENRVLVTDLIYPLFVTHGHGVKNEIDPMPGIHQFSLDRLVDEIEEVVNLDISAILLFGVPGQKDEFGTEAFNENGIIQEAIRVIKRLAPSLLIIADTCLCGYTDHGHCGVISDGEVDNDQTLDLLEKIAVSQAESGADVVAPSAMMDGQVKVIRKSLDSNGFSGVPIMAYSAKYASSFYGPFRVAAESSPEFGDRRGYQIDPPNIREAMREIEQDILEGADMVMVKPALPYLDVISRARNSFSLPIVAYNVSGEYAMVKAANRNGWIDGKNSTQEILTAIKRAGADLIITYHAKEMSAWMASSGAR